MCKKQCGVNIEVHHLKPEEEDGTDELDNAIPVCFDCHSEVQRYNDKHPKGTKFKVEELKARREQVYEQFTRPLIPPVVYQVTQSLGPSASRTLPDVGFIIHNAGDTHGVRAQVELSIKRGGKSFGAPDASYYAGKKLWHLNPRSGVSGHFSLSAGVMDTEGELQVEVQVTMIDVYDREHKELAVAYTFDQANNSWYLEPSP